MRLYNGCPDSELRAIMSGNEKALAAVRRLIPEAHCTYHSPALWYTKDYGYHIHVWGKSLSGYHPTIIDACKDALERLTRGNR
jgi:hypothetical protein